MCRTQTSIYSCGHSMEVEEHCLAYIESNGQRCKHPSGSENRVENYCPDCSQWKGAKRRPPRQKSVNELAIMVPERKHVQQDPNCGNPKSAEGGARDRCDAM
ncbi:hypothetical protein SMMN14_03040 [Sphaerulina musiva]